MRGPVAIVGYMGSGKTTVGRALAGALGLEFVDLDRMLVKRAGRSIAEIFAREGEDHFRDLEHRVLSDALEGGGPPCVLACGGGVVERPENRALLGAITTVFLREELGVLYERTRGPSRPLRAGGREGFERRYAERLPLYREVADLEVEARGRPPREVAEEVVRCLPAS